MIKRQKISEVGVTLATVKADSDISSSISLKHTQNTDTGTTGNTFTIDSDSSTGKMVLDVALNAGEDHTMTITNEVMADDVVLTLPALTGTLALVSSLGSHRIIDVRSVDAATTTSVNWGATGDIIIVFMNTIPAIGWDGWDAVINYDTVATGNPVTINTDGTKQYTFNGVFTRSAATHIIGIYQGDLDEYATCNKLFITLRAN